jgi:ABC-type dipeptide/oligopeptide/nickel transport system permease component
MMTIKVSQSEAPETIIWQKKLLPFAITAISLMAIFFFISSVIQIDRLADRVIQLPNDKIEKSLAAFESKSPDISLSNLDYIKWKSMLLLEQDMINHRYAQVNSTLLLRAWTRNIGFLTGMIMAFIGAIFILSKLREGETSLAGEGGGAKATLVTSSPGIVLAVLGTILMSVTIVSGFEFSTTDAPVYVGRDNGSGDDVALPPPAPLEDLAPLQEATPPTQEEAP